MRVLCLLRDSAAFRREAFLSGFASLGYKAMDRIERPVPEDVLVIWNRYGPNAVEADRFERQGARVLVVENGHLGKAWRSGVWYSIAIARNAGAGRWRDGGPERWDSWNVELAPWKQEGHEYVVFGQRGIGEPSLRSPPNWADRMMEKLHRGAVGKIRIRPHPRVLQNVPSLENDLSNAIATITWNSTAGIASLMLGVPVYYECATWIGAQAALPVQSLFQKIPPVRDDAKRLAMFRRLAWAMWEIDEIRAGLPFRHLLH